MACEADSRLVSDWWAAIQDGEYPGEHVPTGFEELDPPLGGGLPRGGLTLVAGRPSMGVSALLQSIVLRAAQSEDNPRSSILAPLEYGPYIATQRFMTMLSGVNPTKPPRAGHDNSRDIRLAEAAKEFGSLPIRIWDAPRELIDFADQTAQLRQGKHIDILAVDSALLLRPVTSEGTDRSEEIRSIYASLKRLAVDLDVAVLAGVDLRFSDDAWPRYHQICEPQAFERYADLVMIVHRPMYYCGLESDLPDWCRHPAEARLIVPFNRRGLTWTAKVMWDADRVRFVPFDYSAQLGEGQAGGSSGDHPNSESVDVPF